jgi:hypothetical protein
MDETKQGHQEVKPFDPVVVSFRSKKLSRFSLLLRMVLTALLMTSLPATKRLNTCLRSRSSLRMFSDLSNYVTPLPSLAEQVFVISGSSRGIGLEFSRQLLLRTEDTKVIGLSRTSTPSLLELQAKFPGRMHVVHVDLENQESVVAAGKTIASLVTRVDLLLNVAGILGDGGKTPSTPGPERSLLNIDREWFSKTLDLNLVGHVMMTQSLMPLLKKPKDAPGRVRERDSQG